MTNNKFFRGEDIVITANLDGNEDFTVETPCRMLVYPADLDLCKGDTSKIVEATAMAQESNIVFRVAHSTTATMQPGEYNIEIVYEPTEGQRTILRSDRAFTLEDSAAKNATNLEPANDIDNGDNNQ